jgi:hypothetical protein
MERAGWVPRWYGLDQSLAVGQPAEFSFWRIAREELRDDVRLVFYNDLWKPDDAVVATGTIARIWNAELGEIREVDTESQSFDYLFHLADGTTLDVNAEEEPGRLYDASGLSPRIVRDWYVFVTFESLSELRPARRRAMSLRRSGRL